MVDQLKGWGFIILGVALVIVPFLNSTIGGWWQVGLQIVGVFALARLVYRWARRRYSAAPGLRGFVPHRTPWAP
jgi:membrane protein implicated in regulation of membrane protease activity